MAQFEKLRRITLGVPLVTLHNPDASPEDERSYQTKRGQEAKGSGGRPRDKKPGHKTRERKEKLPKVSKLTKEGRSVREIARKLNISKSTVERWQKELSDQ